MLHYIISPCFLAITIIYDPKKGIASRLAAYISSYCLYIMMRTCVLCLIQDSPKASKVVT